ncbi:MAG: peptidase U32 family protein [Candidatus Omnitrophota bacterium]
MSEKILKPELAAPAGDWGSMTAAVDAGADAVYFGIKGMNMRHMAGNFHINELPKVMAFLKKMGKKGYLALNTVMLQPDLERVKEVLLKAGKAGADAVILWDLAVLKMAKDAGLPIHLSTQASVANVEAVKYYAKLGVKQIVLARECTLNDIREIIRRLSLEKVNCRIETFIHGAMCVSVSGRCFLSHEIFRKSANQGQCLQPCRRRYRIIDAEGECEYLLGESHLLSPKDLCTIDIIDQLIKAGIAAFKIEGRMRSPEYVRVATSCYRRAIDAYFNKSLNNQLKADLKKELSSVYNRGFSTGFFKGSPDHEAWSEGLSHEKEKVFAGDVTRFFKKISVAEIRLRSAAIHKGDELLFIGNKTPGLACMAEEMQKDGKVIENADKSEIFGLKTPFPVRPKDKVFLWRDRKAG